MKKVILITGASSGIGKATALLLHRHGFTVYGTSRRSKPLEVPYTMLCMDVIDRGSIQRVVDTIVEKEGKLDVVINNAGYALFGSFEDTTMEEARNQMETNFFGFVQVSQSVLTYMRPARKGLIINIGSIGGRIGLPYQSFYSASKFATKGITEALRIELANFNIKVVLIEPGDVITGITDNRIVSNMKMDSPYFDQHSRTLEVVQQDERSGCKSDLIAKKILSVINKRYPSCAYPVGHFLQVLSIPLKSLLPSLLFEKIISSHYRFVDK